MRLLFSTYGAYQIRPAGSREVEIWYGDELIQTAKSYKAATLLIDDWNNLP